jgi:hypothetical protein
VCLLRTSAWRRAHQVALGVLALEVPSEERRMYI